MMTREQISDIAPFYGTIGEKLEFDCIFKMTDYILKYRGTDDLDDIIEVIRGYGEAIIEEEQYELMPAITALYEEVVLIHKTGLIL